jgi:hypothetical protein
MSEKMMRCRQAILDCQVGTKKRAMRGLVVYDGCLRQTC